MKSSGAELSASRPVGPTIWKEEKHELSRVHFSSFSNYVRYVRLFCCLRVPSAGTGVKSLLMLPTSRAKRADVKANAMLNAGGAIAEPAMKRRALADTSRPLSFAHHYRRLHDDSKHKNEVKE